MNKKKGINPPNAKSYSNIRNDWSKDRNAFVVMQRNFFIALSLIAMAGIIVAMVVIKSMVEKNAIEPYVISVNTLDKMPVAVPAQSVKEYANANIPVIEYFIVKYIKARESFDPNTFRYDNSTITRIMSTSDIYQAFRKIVNNPDNNPRELFGPDGRVEVAVKNLTHNSKEAVITVRIAKKIGTANTDAITSTMHYQIKLHYVLETKDMTIAELQVNPLGIKIDTYQINEEKVFEEEQVVE